MAVSFVRIALKNAEGWAICKHQGEHGARTMLIANLPIALHGCEPTGRELTDRATFYSARTCPVRAAVKHLPAQQSDGPIPGSGARYTVRDTPPEGLIVSLKSKFVLILDFDYFGETPKTTRVLWFQTPVLDLR